MGASTFVCGHSWTFYKWHADCCGLFDQYERRGREQGIQIGMAQGREEGIAQGIAQGVAKGMVQGTELGQLKTIQSFMKKLNLTVEEALEAADVPKSEWSKYESKLNIQH